MNSLTPPKQNISDIKYLAPAALAVNIPLTFRAVTLTMEKLDTSGQDASHDAPGKWRIAMCEKPLSSVGVLDNLLYGKDASHSFLALVDPNGDVVEEMHGFSVNTRSNEPATASMGLRQFFNALAAKKGEPIRTDHPNKLRVTVAPPNEVPGTLNENAQMQVITSGDDDEIHRRWNSALQRGQQINDMHVDYIPIGMKPGHHGQNCHSVTSDALDAMGVEARLTPTFARPGFKRMIVNEISQDVKALGRMTHELHSSLRKLRRSLRPEKVLTTPMEKLRDKKPGLSSLSSMSRSSRSP